MAVELTKEFISNLIENNGDITLMRQFEKEFFTTAFNGREDRRTIPIDLNTIEVFCPEWIKYNNVSKAENTFKKYYQGPRTKIDKESGTITLHFSGVESEKHNFIKKCNEDIKKLSQVLTDEVKSAIANERYSIDEDRLSVKIKNPERSLEYAGFGAIRYMTITLEEEGLVLDADRVQRDDLYYFGIKVNKEEEK